MASKMSLLPCPLSRQLVIPSHVRVSWCNQQRPFYSWLNNIFNMVDSSRIASVGGDRAAAEWLLRCGASVKWLGKQRAVTDYNSLSRVTGRVHIESIDATDSAIMETGFDYLKHLQHLKAIKLRNCPYVEDGSLLTLCLILRSRLEVLEMIDLKNITDHGLKHVLRMDQLRILRLLDLPSVNNPQDFLALFQKQKPNCIVEWPPFTSKSSLEGDGEK